MTSSILRKDAPFAGEAKEELENDVVSEACRLKSFACGEVVNGPIQGDTYLVQVVNEELLQEVFTRTNIPSAGLLYSWVTAGVVTVVSGKPSLSLYLKGKICIHTVEVHGHLVINSAFIS